MSTKDAALYFPLYLPYMERLVKSLETKLVKARAELHRQKAAVAPISKLPIETLGHIFCVAQDSTDRWTFNLPFTVALVCRHWNSAALQTPALWTKVGVRGAGLTAPGGFPRLWKVLLSSGELSIDISIDLMGFPPSTRMQPIMDVLQPHARRWQTLTIRNTPVELARVLIRPVVDGQTPSLVGLSFISQAWGPLISTLAAPELVLENVGTRLCLLEIQGCTTSRIAPYYPHVANLRTLIFRKWHLPTAHVRALLFASASSLENLRLIDGQTLLGGAGPMQSPARMPRLHTLEISYCRQIYDDLPGVALIKPHTLFHAPSLNHLTLAGLPFHTMLTYIATFPGVETLEMRFRLDARDGSSWSTALRAWWHMLPRNMIRLRHSEREGKYGKTCLVRFYCEPMQPAPGGPSTSQSTSSKHAPFGTSQQAPPSQPIQPITTQMAAATLATVTLDRLRSATWEVSGLCPLRDVWEQFESTGGPPVPQSLSVRSVQDQIRTITNVVKVPWHLEDEDQWW